jgi:hypothetical protein
MRFRLALVALGAQERHDRRAEGGGDSTAPPERFQGGAVRCSVAQCGGYELVRVGVVGESA